MSTHNEETGRHLRKIRTDKAFTKEAIFERTHISIATINKIEAGNFDDIPGIYLQDFLKRYCKVLGINAEEILKSLQTNNQKKKTKIPELPESGQRHSPVNIALWIMFPLLLFLMTFQILFLINFFNRETLKIENQGNKVAYITDNGKTTALNGNEDITLKEFGRIRIENPQKQLIVVEYYGRKWEVLFEKFEVQTINGEG